MSAWPVIALMIGFGVGLTGLAIALGGVGTMRAAGRQSGAIVPSDRSQPRAQSTRSVGWRLVAAVIASGGVGVATRWVALSVTTGLAVLLAARLRTAASARSAGEKVEAIALWTELLRDTLSASAGLAQALIATASCAPGAIRNEVVLLAGRLVNGMPMEAALRDFADDVDDPSADMVVCALVLAARSRAQRLVELLSALAAAIREEVSMRLRVEASRASSRTGVRTVVVFSLAFAGALLVLAHAYLAPYGTITGQLVLALVGLLYALGLVLMVRMVRPKPPPRLLHAGSGQ